jgi:hypothetical protein
MNENIDNDVLKFKRVLLYLFLRLGPGLGLVGLFVLK